MTALSCDVADSTALAQRLDPEALRTTMEQWFADVQQILGRHGGTVEKFVGDAVLAVFGAPRTHEDDALRACRAALEILDATAVVGRFSVRLGIETGEVLVGDVSRGSTFASGVSVILATRLQSVAGPGEALVGPACLRLVRDHVVVEPLRGLALKGIAEPVDAARLLAVADPRDVGAATRVPLVGRARELALLRQAFDRAAVDRTCQLATVLGVAGMGKTRLTSEFVRSLDGSATVLHGRCLSYGEGVTYWPLVEAVRQAADLDGSEGDEEVRRRVADLLGDAPDAPEVVAKLAPVAGLGGEPTTPDDTSWALRRLLTAVARDQALVLVVEDLHWAEPGLVTLLEEVCTWLRDAPVLVLVNARPEFLDDNATWGAGRVNGVTALLEPLAEHEVDALTTEVLRGVLPSEAAERVRSFSGGNPLYVEHLLAMLVEDGTLRRSDTGWVVVADVEHVHVPPTVSALIAARLDRLPAGERAVLGVAAVIGQVFYRAAVTEFSAEPDVGGALAGLLRKGLVEPVESDLAGQQAMRFSHVLVRDAAYDALPKALRADLHERFARWLDRTATGQAVEDFVGGHLEAAYLARSDLGALDERTRALGREASELFASAGTSLLYADDGAAVALLERAIRLRADEGPQRWWLQVELAYAWFRNGSFPAGAEVARALEQSTEATGGIGWAMHARLLLAEARQFMSPEKSAAGLRRTAEEALVLFTELADDGGLASAHDALGDVAFNDADPETFLHECLLAAEHAGRAGHPRQARLHRQTALLPMILGRRPAEEGLAESRRLLAQADHRTDRVLTLSYLAYFAGLLTLHEEATQSFARAEQLAAELHPNVSRWVEFLGSLAALGQGDWPTAAVLCARLRDAGDATGDHDILMSNTALLTHALLHTGEVEEARRRANEAETLNRAAEDVLTRSLITSALGWVAAIDGDRRSAYGYMQEAIAVSPPDLLMDRALVHRACAGAAAVMGDQAVCEEHRQAALDLYLLKGNLAGAANLREVMATAAG